MKKRIIAYAAAALVIVYFCFMFVTQQITINQSKKKITELEEEISAVKEESKKLRDEIENAESRETIEGIAREELGLVYPDERKYIDSNS